MDNDFPPGRAGHASIEQTAGSYQATHATHECRAGPHIGDKPPTPNSGAGAAKKRANPAEPAKHHIDAKKLEAAKRISLARFSSRTSASSCLIFWASPLVVPGRFPASMSACLHQPRKYRSAPLDH